MPVDQVVEQGRLARAFLYSLLILVQKHCGGISGGKREDSQLSDQDVQPLFAGICYAATSNLSRAEVCHPTEATGVCHLTDSNCRRQRSLK
jgi:hypothetical protein